MRKGVKTTFWILIILFFVGSGAAFYFFNSRYWKITLLGYLQRQIAGRYNLTLVTTGLEGSAFRNLHFPLIALQTPSDYTIIKLTNLNINYRLLPLIFQERTVSYLDADRIQWTYPGSIDTLKQYLKSGDSPDSRIGFSVARFEFAAMEALGGRADSAIFRAERISGRGSFSADSIALVLQNADMSIQKIDGDIKMTNSEFSLIRDSLRIHHCRLRNLSTDLILDGTVELDSLNRFTLDFQLNDFVFADRYPGNGSFFKKRDYLNLKGNVSGTPDAMEIQLGFDGQLRDRPLDSGSLIGELRGKEFDIRQLIIAVQDESISGTVAGRLDTGLVAKLNIKKIDLEKWDTVRLPTDIKGSIGLRFVGPVQNPDEIWTDFDLKESVVDTLVADSIRGSLVYRHGGFQVRDTMVVTIANTTFGLLGRGNIPQNTLFAQIYVNSANVTELASLAGVSSLQGRLQAFFEASGELQSPDVRGWLQGYDLGTHRVRFGELVARFGLTNVYQHNFGNIYVEAKNGQVPFLKDSIPLASMIVRFEGDTTRVRSLRVVGDELNVELQGRAVRFSDIYIDRVSAYRKGNTLRNLEPIHFSLAADTIRWEDIDLKLNDGNLRLSGLMANRRIKRSKLVIADLDITPFNAFLKGAEGVDGILSGEIAYVDTATIPLVTTTMTLDSAKLFKNEFKQVYLATKLVKDRLMIEQLMIEDREAGYATGQGYLGCNYPFRQLGPFIDPRDSLELFLNFDHFDFHTFDPFLLPKLSKDGKMSGDFIARHTVGDPICRYEFEVAQPVLDRLKGDLLTIRGEYHSGKLEFTSMNLRDQQGVSTGSGYLPFDFSVVPPKAVLERDSSLYMNFSIHSSQLPFITRYNDNVESINGEFDLALSISGTARNPIRSGNFIVRKGIIQLTDLENPVTSVEGSAVLNGNRMEIVSLSGYLRKPRGRTGTFERITRGLRAITWDILFPPKSAAKESNLIVEGQIDFSQFFKPNFDVRLKGDELYIRSLLAEQEGIIDGEFTVQGQDSLNIEGEVVVNQFIIRNEFRGSERLLEREPQKKSLTTVNVHSIIPGNLYFRNSQLDAELEGEVWIIKNGPEPYRFSGTLDIRKGKFFYYGWEFDIVRGSIIFDPTEFNPTLDIEAQVDLAYDTTRTVTGEDDNSVAVRLTGDLENPTLEFESKKYTESDILMFLTRAQGTGDEAFGQDRLSSDAMNVFGMYFERQLERSISQISGLDEFELRTRGNLLANQQPDQWSLMLGQKIAPNLFVKYERNLSLIEPHQQIGIEYRLNRNISIAGDIDQNGLLSINYRYKYRY